MINRARIPASHAEELDYQAARSRERRAARKAAGQCLCGPAVGFVGIKGVEHGPPVSPSGRCARCVAARKAARS